MQEAPRLGTLWKSYEFVETDAQGAFVHGGDPISQALVHRSSKAKTARQRMQRLEDRGWPEAEQTMFIPRKRGDRKKAIVKPNAEKYPDVWLLKCTPTAWRLYFYIWENGDDKRIIYLHALYKQAIGDDEVVTAGDRHRRLCAGDCCKIAKLEFRH